MTDQVTEGAATYKCFFDETPVALIQTDIETGEFLMANKCAATMLGFDTVEELKATVKTTDLYPASQRQRLIEIMKQNGKVEGFEIEFKLPNRTIWVSATLRINCEGQCIEGSLKDITESVELRQKQLRLLREVGKKLDKKLSRKSDPNILAERQTA